MHKIFNSIYWHPILIKAFLAILCLVGAIWLVFAYLNPAPPSTITIATGFRGGAYEYFGQQYRERLARVGVTLVVHPTDGTGENLKLLLDLADNMTGKTICVLSDSCAAPVVSAIAKFRPEFEAYFSRNKSAALAAV